MSGPDLIGPAISVGLAGIAVIIWLIRLEGRVNGKADTSVVVVLSEKISAIELTQKIHAETRDEVIRLQEQIKHLTSLIERGYLAEAPAARRRTVAK